MVEDRDVRVEVEAGVDGMVVVEEEAVVVRKQEGEEVVLLILRTFKLFLDKPFSDLTHRMEMLPQIHHPLTILE
jgi:hypothetical protein